MNDHIARMLNDAEERLHDAEILATSLTGGSSSSLLRILALEVLLKAAQYAEFGRYQPTHKYFDLWKSLPENMRTNVLAIAAERFADHVDLADVEALMNDWHHAFTKGRYYYEIYEGCSYAEQRALGESWLARGAPDHEAAVRFHPMELSAITEGLMAVIESRYL